MNKMTYVYVAAPYTHLSKRIMSLRETMITATVGYLIDNGMHAYSPITESAQYQKNAGLDGTWDFWGTRDTDILRRMDELLVLMLPGWEDSVGVAAEVEIAKRLGMKISYMGYREIRARVFHEMV